ncbi:MAG TPA: TSUP family transporter [Pseudonocardiaceae bacterium]|nr:TSUP family transporter [Pseudonocardiaceae bacterium]
MLIVLLAVGVGAIAQAVAGFGFALICGPLLIAALGQADGLRLIVTLSTLVSLVILASTWRAAKLRDGLLLALPGVLLAPVFVWLLRDVDKNALTVAAGATTLVATATLALGRRFEQLRGIGGVVTAGATSALMNVLGGMSGPVAALYAVNARWPEKSITPTLQVFGITLNIVTLASVGGPTLDWRAVLSLLAGWLVGYVVARVLPAGRTRHIVLLVAAAGGAFAVWRGLAG